ncbi:MAG: sigma-70 family RNA polymerase sigma factor [Planctomycetota bacterium]|nr:sigma-70 family RNA polymerase sigma factor [Planctomycetota bacterium]
MTDEQILEKLRQGGTDALAEFYSEYHDRLWRMVHFRLDRRLRGRVDADDILQEAYLDAVDRIHHHIENQQTSLFVWLRMVVCQTMVNVHRRHIGTGMRDANREVSIGHGPNQQATSICIAAQLVGSLTSPSHVASRDEMAGQLESALEGMSEIDREVLALRHFEELGNNEVAEVLGIQPKAASVRYFRALKRLKAIAEKLPGLNLP